MARAGEHPEDPLHNHDEVKAMTPYYTHPPTERRIEPPRRDSDPWAATIALAKRIDNLEALRAAYIRHGLRGSGRVNQIERDIRELQDTVDRHVAADCTYKHGIKKPPL